MSQDDRHSQQPQHERPSGFTWKVTIRADDLDFMRRDDAFAASTDCTNCSAASPLPTPPRKPRHRREAAG